MSGARLLGVLLVLLGGLLLWEVVQGRDPRTHLNQLVDLLFHTHLSPAPTAAQGASGFGPGAGADQGVAGGGGGSY